MRGKILLVVIVVVVLLAIYFGLPTSTSSNSSITPEYRNAAGKLFSKIHNDMANDMTFAEFKDKTGIDDSILYTELKQLYSGDDKVTSADYKKIMDNN